MFENKTNGNREVSVCVLSLVCPLSPVSCSVSSMYVLSLWQAVEFNKAKMLQPDAFMLDYAWLRVQPLQSKLPTW